MQGKKILVTGVTGQVGFPFALHHADENDLWAIARFGDQEKRDALETAGATCQVVDLMTDDFGELPKDFDYVFHFAVFKPDTVDFDLELRGNSEATGRLMSWCREATGFFTVQQPASTKPSPTPSLLKTLRWATTTAT